ncbi:hypothetical protein PSPO01_14677 [Paraphaeosphaeria sporulosa]
MGPRGALDECDCTQETPDAVDVLGGCGLGGPRGEGKLERPESECGRLQQAQETSECDAATAGLEQWQAGTEAPMAGWMSTSKAGPSPWGTLVYLTGLLGDLEAWPKARQSRQVMGRPLVRLTQAALHPRFIHAAARALSSRQRPRAAKPNAHAGRWHRDAEPEYCPGCFSINKTRRRARTQMHPCLHAAGAPSASLVDATRVRLRSRRDNERYTASETACADVLLASLSLYKDQLKTMPSRRAQLPDSADQASPCRLTSFGSIKPRASSKTLNLPGSCRRVAILEDRFSSREKILRPMTCRTAVLRLHRTLTRFTNAAAHALQGPHARRWCENRFRVQLASRTKHRKRYFARDDRWGRLSTDSPCKRINCLSMHAPHLIANFGAWGSPGDLKLSSEGPGDLLRYSCSNASALLEAHGSPVRLQTASVILISGDVMQCGARGNPCKRM